MEWVCGLAVGVLILAAVGHLLWLAGAAIVKALFDLGESPQSQRPQRLYNYCPACRADVEDADAECRECGLQLDSRLAREIHRVRVTEREVRGLLERDQIDRQTADEILNQLEARARTLQGLPTKRGARPRAMPASVAQTSEPHVELAEPRPQPELSESPSPALVTEPFSEAGKVAASGFPHEPVSESNAIPVATLEERSAVRASTEPPIPPAPPKRRFSEFLEEHNIFWGELVGGLLIVGCSIALVVTLWRRLEEIRYFPFGLSFLVTLALFGAGQYTLHRWKLSGTSRGMLVISMLLTPLTILMLADPVAHGRGDTFDIGLKLLALVAFVGIVHTGGRDLIGTEHLPGPIDRRWLLALAVVGAAGTQLLPASASPAWLPLLCFLVACGATLGGLSWYHPGRREEPISEKSGTALLVFVGLAAFALLCAWGLHVAREPARIAARLHDLAVPLALVGVPVVEAGILVFRRVTTSPGLRTAGTGIALAGFVAMTAGLALAWSEPLYVLLVSAAGGLFLTRVAFRERLAWVQIGAIPLLAHACVVGFQGFAAGWTTPAEVYASAWLADRLASAESGAVLVGFALLLALLAEVLARRTSVQTVGYAFGAVGVAVVGLLLVSLKGTERPEMRRSPTRAARSDSWPATTAGSSAFSRTPDFTSFSSRHSGRCGGSRRSNPRCGGLSSRRKRSSSRPDRWRYAARTKAAQR